jgi:hypothetical protein
MVFTTKGGGVFVDAPIPTYLAARLGSIRWRLSVPPAQDLSQLGFRSLGKRRCDLNQAEPGTMTAWLDRSLDKQIRHLLRESGI